MNLFGTMRGPRHLVFGSGQRRALPDYVRLYGSRALFVTDERLGNDAEFRAMVDAVKAAGVATEVFSRALPEVPVSSIEEAVALGKTFGPDVIVGVGGGSCMDLAKLTAVLMAHGGRAQDYYGEYKVPGPVVPLIALPTTAGTGSEVTPVAVLADPDRPLKVGVSSPELIPTVAICDPDLTFGAPAKLTAHAGADALTHAIEPFTAIVREATPDLTRKAVFVGKNIISDAYAREAIRLISGSLETAVKDGNNRPAREAMMLGATFAGLAFGNAGNAAAHALQYPVGAKTHTSHGAGVACLMPYVMEYNRPAVTPALAEIADLMGVAPTEGGEDARAGAAIDAVADLFARIGIERTAKELGLAENEIGPSAEQAMSAARLVNNNPRTLDASAMEKILRAAWSGDRASLRGA